MKFKATVRKITDNSFGVTIPKAYIDNGQLEEGQEYQFDVNEVKE